MRVRIRIPEETVAVLRRDTRPQAVFLLCFAAGLSLVVTLVVLALRPRWWW